MHNNVLTPLTLLVRVGRDRDGAPAFDVSALRSAVAIIDLSEKRSFRELSVTSHQEASATLELYLRRMLSRCALRVHVPYRTGERMPNPRQLRPFLAPTIYKTIRFVDRFDRHWDAVVAYMRPISRGLDEDQKVSELAWNLYQLILATKYRAEVVLPPQESLELIAGISTSSTLTSEARARLAVIEGLFMSFSRSVQAPSFRFLPSAPAFAISERISEIMEDAYLLEASHLLRLLGIRENITSIQRDLRKLLAFIQRRRGWARGILGVGSDMILGAKVPLAFLEKITEIAPTFGDTESYPILSESDSCIASRNESTIRFVRTLSDGTLVELDKDSSRVVIARRAISN